MNNDELLVMLSCVSNRSLNQTKLLFDLCDNDFEKLMKVEACVKKTFVSYCPGDKELVNDLVNTWDELREKDKSKQK